MAASTVHAADPAHVRTHSRAIHRAKHAHDAHNAAAAGPRPPPTFPRRGRFALFACAKVPSGSRVRLFSPAAAPAVPASGFARVK